MSKDNREECPDCLGHGREIDGEQQRRVCEKCLKDYGLGGYHVDCVDCLTNCCTTCDGTGEVTTDSGADVCKWVKEYDKKGHRFRYYIKCTNSHNVTERMFLAKDRSFKFCPYCGKTIVRPK